MICLFFLNLIYAFPKRTVYIFINYAIALNEHPPPQEPELLPQELLATLPAVSPPVYATWNALENPLFATLPAVSPPFDVENIAVYPELPDAFENIA